MTTQRKVAIKKSANKTKHQRAMANPKVQELVSNLARDWAAIDHLERDARLRELAAHGCSARGLGKVLGHSASSILREVAPEERPKTDRNVEEARASAQEAVSQRANAERDECQRQRIIEEEKTGALSDEVATVILEFCRAGQGLPETPILPGDVPLLLSTAERYLSNFEASDRRPVRIPEDMDLKEIFRLARPDAQKGDPWIEHQAKWLANVVWAKAPERRIWKPALRKAVGRAGELTPPLSQADRDRDRKERLSTIADLPVRLNRDIGARALGRQGRPTKPPAERL
jgi:hypothetical protein